VGAFALDEKAPASVLRKGQCPVMVAVGRRGGVLLLDAATGSACYKGKRTRSLKAIDGGIELGAAVTSDAVSLMASQSWKQRCSLFPMQATESAWGARGEAAMVAHRRRSKQKGEDTHRLRD
jgi:hypothetical protein